MKNIKDITISIFAIIGFVAILSSFNNQSQDPHTTPESHVWEFHISPNPSDSSFSINKVTGEVRKYNYGAVSRTVSKGEDKFVVMVETK